MWIPYILNLFYFKKPRRKVNGEAHKSTIRSPIGINEIGKTVTCIKTRLEDIPFDENGDFLCMERIRTNIPIQQLKKGIWSLKG